MNNKETSPEFITRRRFLQIATATAVVTIPTLYSCHQPVLGFFSEAAKRRFLEDLQHRQLMFFLENQTPGGLMLDRQHNRGKVDMHGLCSTAATGMGLIALSLAAQPEYRLLSKAQAALRIERAIQAAHRLPQKHGIMPHFLDSKLNVLGEDHFSTIDSSWLIIGALISAQILGDSKLIALAKALYDRVDWRYWADDPTGESLLFMGQAADGSFLHNRWDKLTAETAFMYLMAFGAQPERALQKSVLPKLGVLTADEWKGMGLFAAQYSNCLLDGDYSRRVMGIDLIGIERAQTETNRFVCGKLGALYGTYSDKFWGLSAGDGPGSDGDIYRTYAPITADGTAHITATLPSIEVAPQEVIDNAVSAAKLRIGPDKLDPVGKYGLSNINIDRHWISRDVVGIDIGAATMALDNYLHRNRVRQAVLKLEFAQRAAKVLAG